VCLPGQANWNMWQCKRLGCGYTVLTDNTLYPMDYGSYWSMTQCTHQYHMWSQIGSIKFSSCILVKADVLFNYCPNSVGMWGPCEQPFIKASADSRAVDVIITTFLVVWHTVFQQVPTVELIFVLISGSWPCLQQKLNWVHKGHYINDKPQNRLQNSQLRRNGRWYPLLLVTVY